MKMMPGYATWATLMYTKLAKAGLLDHVHGELTGFADASDHSTTTQPRAGLSQSFSSFRPVHLGLQLPLRSPGGPRQGQLQHVRAAEADPAGRCRGRSSGNQVRNFFANFGSGRRSRYYQVRMFTKLFCISVFPWCIFDAIRHG